MRITARTVRTSIGYRLGAAALIGASVLGVSACGYIAPQQTTHQYSPSDGVRATFNNVEVSNLLIVTKAAGKEGRLLGAVYNNTASTVTVTFNGSNGAQTQVTVKPGVPFYLNAESDAALLSTVASAPGALETVKISSSGGGSTELKVPVLDGTLQEYRGYLPTPAPTMTPGSTSGSSSTATASSTGH
ncbi:hypothetical protein [Psychromicrobium xiongbiense]|uniref:hypothetical protein n=1 Tax=Psychromicrobium xiongbiense TaxID=3051184 RepID=UPI0025570BB0|nr:hypothetical protein [Psychromicrobium sp. YIM S02556]